MASLSLAKLINRKLIRITGPDCYPYLQGLFCNDLRYLYEPDRVQPRQHANVSSSIMSTFMLNAQGRVICDLLLYRTPRTKYECKFTPPGEAKELDELLIECDANLASGLANTLYGYRVRRKVTLELIPDQQVWCLYPKLTSDSSNLPTADSESRADQLLLLESLKPIKEVVDNNMTIVSDPRLDLMGIRIISKSSDDFNHVQTSLKSQIGEHNISESSVRDYIVHRYKLGVGEGPEDHPEGNCLPLESNADCLNSVSFNKGCYLGQELTARIHYTGVVRKRLMPCLLDINRNKPSEVPLVSGSDIVDQTSGKKLGILRNIVRGHALSLLRHDQISPTTNLIHEASKTNLTTWRPYWWNLA